MKLANSESLTSWRGNIHIALPDNQGTFFVIICCFFWRSKSEEEKEIGI